MTKNIIFLLLILVISVTSIITGKKIYGKKNFKKESAYEVEKNLPKIGSVEVLNGCGIPGAANKVAEYLRKKQIDVKNIDNAPTWNYDSTIVVSKINDLTTAKKVAKILGTKNVIILRDPKDILYDVTVYVGKDYGELTNE